MTINDLQDQFLDLFDPDWHPKGQVREVARQILKQLEIR